MFSTQFIPPSGFHFNPTDEELIMFYLVKKVMGFPLPCDRVVERQVYGENKMPWEVFPEEDESWNHCEDSKKNVVFVLCRLLRVGENSNSKRICRIAGCGTWNGKSLTQDVMNRSGAIIGKKRAFTFKPMKEFETEAKEKGRWIMHELSLPEEINKVMNNNDHYVICRITRDRYEPKIEHVSGNKTKQPQRSDEEHEGLCWKKACDKIYEEEEGDSFTLIIPQQEEKGDSFGVNINGEENKNEDLIDLSCLFDGDVEDYAF